MCRCFVTCSLAKHVYSTQSLFCSAHSHSFAQHTVTLLLSTQSLFCSALSHSFAHHTVTLLFSTRSLLERHIDSHRDQEFPNSFRCSDCNRTYATRNGYLKHKRQGTCYKRDVFHEDGTQGEFECQLCRTHFTTDRLLSLHKEKVRGGGGGPSVAVLSSLMAKSALWWGGGGGGV